MSDRKTLPIGDALWTWVDSGDTPMQVASLMIFRPTEPGVEFARRLHEHWRSFPATSRPFIYLIRARPVSVPGTREFNLVISNVPGPRSALYAGDARMEEFYPMSLLSKNEALNITILSYDGQLNFGFTASRGVLPRIQDVSLYTAAAVDELEYAVVERGGK